jgi:hypothetical protein
MLRLTRSSNPLPDFNAVEWREACTERRQIRARLAAIEEELNSIALDNDAHKLAVDMLTDDAMELMQSSIVSLNDYRQFKHLINDAETIKNKVIETEAGLLNEQAVLEHKLSEIETDIKLVKKIFREAMRKVIPFERQRSKTAGIK